MFKRKLTALDYHSPNSFNVNDTLEYRNLVLWLEDRKICHYKIEDRKALRDVNSSDWPKAFKQYRDDLACPVLTEKPGEQLEWLLALAVRQEYCDNVEKYKNCAKKNELNTPKVVSANPLDNLDFEGADFKMGVNTLAQLLHVTQHPNHLITLKAVSKVVCQRLSAEAARTPSNFIVKGKPFPFQEAELGFDTGDYLLNQAAKILRLLYIHDLRDLQTHINECIVAIQTVTANPKTDTKLGKVGK